MNIRTHLLACGSALLALLAGPYAHAATGGVSGPISDSGPIAHRAVRISAKPADTLASRHLRQARAPAGQSPLAGGSLTLRGELAGDWDDVDGNVVFTYDFTAEYPDIGHLQVFVRGFPAAREPGSTRYSVEWDRAAYWLDFDGDGPDIPRLLPAMQLVDAYVPVLVDDPYPEFAEDPQVMAECTASTPCTIQMSRYVLLREPGEDYSNYPDEAASSDLLFVANRFGQAVAAVLDVYDENDEYVETKDLVEGDELQFSVVGFKLNEPQFIYLIEYTEFTELAEDLRIELDNYIPGSDFPDPMLLPDLNAGQRRMKLLLDANITNAGVTTFAFGGPFDLGFTWAHALDYLSSDSFEDLRSAPTSIAPVVKRR